jgi:DNA-directed RNA polymerase specialized sigma24 family protein
MLRKPGKLHAWLFGIARNRINNALRRDGREPLLTAEAWTPLTKRRRPTHS